MTTVFPWPLLSGALPVVGVGGVSDFVRPTIPNSAVHPANDIRSINDAVVLNEFMFFSPPKFTHRQNPTYTKKAAYFVPVISR
jgi:hypothetical protein